jgi:hypothetical protein
MPDDARHDRDAALRGTPPHRRKRGAAAAVPTGPAATAAATTGAGVTRAGGCLAHLRREPFPAPRRSRSSVAPPSRSHPKIMLVAAHGAGAIS